MDLPLFPLHLVLYPGRPLPLHLFEARYRQMLRDCLELDGRFGVVAIKSGREVGSEALIHDVGTVTKIKTVSERQDGRYDIITVGCGRFRVLEVQHDRPYLHAQVTELGEADDPQDLDAAEVLRRVLVPYLKEMGLPDEFCDRLPLVPAELSYLACSSLQVEVPVQQRLLELPGHAERMLETARIIRRESSIIRHLGDVRSFRPPGPGGAQLN